jgi:hypothetical protein
MAKKMKRREIIKSKLGGNQIASKFECEDKKKEKMVVILFDRKKIILLKLEKFQQWILF